ncbi:MAG: hypothetical protein HW418_4186, partial [Anaerolineales bacterium]|nr:hypothetical protein [Anaerolineales bacterium]
MRFMNMESGHRLVLAGLLLA